MNLTASKCGIEASQTPPALVGYLVINTSDLPQVDNYDILLVVGFNYNFDTDVIVGIFPPSYAVILLFISCFTNFYHLDSLN